MELDFVSPCWVNRHWKTTLTSRYYPCQYSSDHNFTNQPNLTEMEHTKKAPTDRQVIPVISNNKTNKKKKKKIKKKQEKRQVSPPNTRSSPKPRSKTKPRTQQKTTHKIKQPIVTLEEVNSYLQHVENNPELDEFLMNNITIRRQIAKCEVAYYKIRHTHPVLVEVDMIFYHSLSSVQLLLGEISRLKSFAMSFKATNIRTTSNKTMCTTATQIKPQKLYRNRQHE